MVERGTTVVQDVADDRPPPRWGRFIDLQRDHTAPCLRFHVIDREPMRAVFPDTDLGDERSH